jgi:stage V sporulation protein AD
MVGKVVDGLTTDGSNMGAAMARAAFDSITTFFSLSGRRVEDYDKIVTGDLGRVGSEVLRELLSDEIPEAALRHVDCGTLLYGEEKPSLMAGASGCGCSAALLAAEFIPKLRDGELSRILFLSTGALMNPQSVLQGKSILGVAPVIDIGGVKCS